MKGLFVTATDTNVGKTWVGSRLISALKAKGVLVKPRKPIESGWNEDETQTDAWLLADAVDQVEKLDDICPNRFLAALSPDRAAFLEGKELSLKQLKKVCLKDLNDGDFLYVEGAGGFYSPLCVDALNADLAVALNLPVLLVVEDRLGCINQALLNIEAIQQQGLKLLAIVLNSSSEVGASDEGMDNFSDLQKRLTCPVIKVGYSDFPNDAMTQLCEMLMSTNPLLNKE